MVDIEYILFDAAQTLIYKPRALESFYSVLKRNGYDFKIRELTLRHKIISEILKFPNVTNEEFYNEFNAEVLLSLGIVPNHAILLQLFQTCKNLPWEAYQDTAVLKEIKIPCGVLSNFSGSLKQILSKEIPFEFDQIIISEEEGVSKPDSIFFKIASDKINVKPNNILYVGDSMKLDVLPGRQAGFQSYIIDRDKYFGNEKNRLNDLKEILNII